MILGGNMIKQFKDDDEGYFNFIRKHPEAFVFNYFQRSSTEYNKLHRANCQFLPTIENGKKATTVRKIVSNDYFELIKYLEKLGMKLNRDFSFCRICAPQPKTANTVKIKTAEKEEKASGKYDELVKKSSNFLLKWNGKIDSGSLDDFIKEVQELDKFRFNTSYEWQEPVTYDYTKKYIFENPDPDKGLLLFFLCCWLDLQMDYRTVWSKYLEQAKNWVDDPENTAIPRGSYPTTERNLVKTLNVANKSGNISNWLKNKLLEIVKENHNGDGNLYRLAGNIMSDLLEPSKELRSTIDSLKYGYVELLGNWKRLWMLVMFLRRDKNIIKNLLIRAFKNKKDGLEALNYWYKKDYFNENESELPVDIRIRERWPKLWNQRGMTEKDVAYNYLLQNRIGHCCKGNSPVLQSRIPQ
jgi:hypothetical protein